MAAVDYATRSPRWGIGSPLMNGVGPVLASAATIAPTYKIHHVSGTAEIATITPPWDGFCDKVILISDGIFTWAATGNIAKAGTSTATLRAFVFWYDPNAALWYPQVVA